MWSTGMVAGGSLVAPRFKDLLRLRANVAPTTPARGRDHGGIRTSRDFVPGVREQVHADGEGAGKVERNAVANRSVRTVQHDEDVEIAARRVRALRERAEDDNRRRG